MPQLGWRCATCGATNPFGNRRCRLCQTLVPPGLVAEPPSEAVMADAAPAAPVSPAVPVAPGSSAVDVPPPFLPPPGGWQGGDDLLRPLPPPPLPPPPLPPGGYQPPPPGWYPGAPPPPRKRRPWVVAVCVAVPVVVIAAIAVGVGFARGADPAAARDRDAADRALLVNHDLGGTFHEVAHRTFARSRAGMRVDDDIAECGAADNAFESDGRAVVDSILQAQSGISMQILAQEVLIVGSPASATPVVDAMLGTLRSCVNAGFRKGAKDVGIAVNLSSARAPEVGDRAAAYEGSAGANGVAISIDILIAQQGRAIALVMAFDSTGGFHGPRMEAAMRTLLTHLAPTFGN